MMRYIRLQWVGAALLLGCVAYLYFGWDGRVSGQSFSFDIVFILGFLGLVFCIASFFIKTPKQDATVVQAPASTVITFFSLLFKWLGIIGMLLSAAGIVLLIYMARTTDPGGGLGVMFFGIVLIPVTLVSVALYFLGRR